MGDRFEFNELPREFDPTSRHEYDHGAPLPEVNPPPAEAQATPEFESKRSEENAPSPAPPVKTERAAAEAVKKAGTPLLTRIISAAAAVAGAAVIGTTYVNEARTEQARFADVVAEQNVVWMEVDVDRWSEALKIRISTDGSDGYEYIEVDPPDETAEQDGERHSLFYEYRAKEADVPRTVTVELIGTKIFMTDVLDSRTVTLTPRPPDESPPAGEATLAAVSYLFDPTTAGGRVYVDVAVTVWSDALSIALTADDFYETFDLTAPRDGEAATHFEYLFEQSDNKGLPERVTVTLLGDGDAILDTREAELTEAVNTAASIVSAEATPDGIQVTIDAPDGPAGLTVAALNQSGETLMSVSVEEDGDLLQETGYYMVFLPGDYEAFGGGTGTTGDEPLDITVNLLDADGGIADSRVVTLTN